MALRRTPRLRAAVLAAAILGTAPPVFTHDSAGQSAGSPPSDIESTAAPRSPVVIDGEEIYSVRGVSAYPAEKRARDIEAKIERLARDPSVTSTSLTLDDQERATWILANGKRVLPVFDEDAELESADRRLLAEALRARLWEAIAAYRTARQPNVIWRHTLLTLSATLALLLGAYLCRLLLRLLWVALEGRYRHHVRDVHVQSFRFVKAEQLWRGLAQVLRFAWGLAVAVMAFFYMRYVLALFPWTRGTANRLTEIALEPGRRIALGLIRSVPDLVFLAVLIVVTRAALNLIAAFFHSVETGSVRLSKFDADWAIPTYKLVRLLVIACALVVAYPYVPGSGTDAFKGVTLFIGVVLSLGSSSLINNVLSGYSMTYRRMFRVGDHVQIGNHVGSVKEMRLLVTHLRTAKNEEVIVPNSTILNTEVVNYSTLAAQEGLILHTKVGIGYEVPWRQVEAMLLEAAARTPGVLRDRTPFVHQIALADFSVTYELNVYCATPYRRRFLYSELHRNILDLFNEYGVQIMTPAYETDPKAPKVVPREQWYADPAPPPAPPVSQAQDGRRSRPTSRH